MFELLRFKKSKNIVVEFQLGAYYSIKTKDDFDIIRLLDLPGDSYHYQLIATNVPEDQSVESIKNMNPIILHIPMDIANLLGKDIKRLGNDPLTIKDFNGYVVYLEEMGVEDDAIDEHLKQLIRFSKEAPQKMRLYQDKDGVFAEHL